MNRYLISFSDYTTEQRQTIIDNIKQIGGWARIDDTTYCIKCNLSTTVDVREAIIGNINGSFRLFVVNITHSGWASYCLPTEIANWLKVKE